MDARVARALDRALAYRREDRFQCAAQFLAALEGEYDVKSTRATTTQSTIRDVRMLASTGQSRSALLAAAGLGCILATADLAAHPFVTTATPGAVVPETAPGDAPNKSSGLLLLREPPSYGAPASLWVHPSGKAAQRAPRARPTVAPVTPKAPASAQPPSPPLPSADVNPLDLRLESDIATKNTSAVMSTQLTPLDLRR
jgi:hypothetical protein